MINIASNTVFSYQGETDYIVIYGYLNNLPNTVYGSYSYLGFFTASNTSPNTISFDNLGNTITNNYLLYTYTLI